MPLFGPPNIEEMIARKDIAGLEKAKQHKDPQISQAAINAIILLQSPQDVQQSIKDTRSPEPAVRAQAAKILGKSGHTIACSSLEKLVDDPDLAVRQNTIQALAELVPGIYEDVFIQHLQDEDEAIRATSALGLSKSSAYSLFHAKKAAAQAALIRALDDTPVVRTRAAVALAHLYFDELYESQIKPLVSDPDPNLRAALAGEMGDRAKRLIVARTRDPRFEYPDQPVSALSGRIQVLLEFMGDTEVRVRFRAAQALGDIGEVYYKADEPYWQDFTVRLKSLLASEESDEVRQLLNGAIVRTQKLRGYR